MTSAEIRERADFIAQRMEVHWKDDQKLHHFSEQLSAQSDEDIFEGLIACFHKPVVGLHGIIRQDVAGTLLAKRRPTPNISLTDIIRSTVPYWDLSVEQLPWYLKLVFGGDVFSQTVHEILDGGGLSEIEKQALDTYLYWGACSEEYILDELRLNPDYEEE